MCADLGPRAAIAASGLRAMSQTNREDELLRARVSIVLNSAPGAMPSYRSAVRCFLAFYEEMTSEEPPLPLRLITYCCGLWFSRTRARYALI